jgi:hypothetical protein
MKTCTKCGETLPLCEFHKSNGKRRADCKKCYNASNNAKKNSRSNAISRLAYTLVGGSRAFYELSKEERQRVRAQATSLWNDGRDFVSASNARKVRTDGFVYIISHPRLPGVKIGRAFDPTSRLNNYQTGCPNRAYKLDYVSPYVQDCPTLERSIHDVLEADRMSGEWFNVDSAFAASIIEQLARSML